MENILCNENECVALGERKYSFPGDSEFYKILKTMSSDNELFLS